MKNTKWKEMMKVPMMVVLPWLGFISTSSSSLHVATHSTQIEDCTLASTQICYGKNTESSSDIEYKVDIPAKERTTPVEVKASFAYPSLQDSVFNYMKTVCAYPEGAFALAIHETGNFTSRTFRLGNNMFGMKAVSMLNCDYVVWSTGDNHNKCGWNDWRECVDAYAAWESRKGITKENTKSIQEYTNHLRRIGYAADPLHAKKVISHFHKIFVLS